MGTNRVCAVIVTYNSDKSLLKCFNSIICQVDAVVIVDNGSNAKSLEMIKSLKNNDKVTLIYNTTNLGIANALNRGVEYALKNKYDWILTLDHDSEVSTGMIQKMLDLYNIIEYKEKVAMLCPEVYDINLNKKIYKVENEENISIIKVAIQSGSLIKAKVFNEIGLFNEELFIYYVDDEFCNRLTYKNYLIIRCKNAILNHEEGKKKSKKVLFKNIRYDNYSDAAIYYISRNSIYMAKNFSTYKKDYYKRLLKDFVKLLIFDRKKLTYFFMGIKHGIKNKYGKYDF